MILSAADTYSLEELASSEKADAWYRASATPAPRHSRRQLILVLTAGIFFAWFSWWRLPDAARERGEQVKSTFDLYRGELADALGFELPATEAEERRMWRLVSGRMLLRVSEDRLSDYTGSLDDFRKKNVEVPSDKDKSARQ
jgi:hypothetical protein